MEFVKNDPPHPKRKEERPVLNIPEHLIQQKRRIMKNGFACGIGTVVEAPAYTNRTQHYSFVVTWILKGSGKYTEDGKLYPLHDGCVCMRRPDRDYLLELDPDTGIRPYLTFPQSVYPALLWLIPELETLPPVWDMPFSEACFEEFVALFDRIAELSSLELYTAMPALIHYILRLTGIDKNRAHNPLYLGKMLLEECSSLSVSEIADRCGINYNTFRKQFSKTFGIPPAQYRIRYRITYAKQLLESGLPVGEIAVQLGYPDIYSFTHQFTAVTGQSPTEFRSGRSRK